MDLPWRPIQYMETETRMTKRNRDIPKTAILCLSAAAFFASALAPNAAQAAAVDFDTQIRPIFEERCYQCHGPEKHKGFYRLDIKLNGLKGGKSGEEVIRPGNAKESLMVRLINLPPDDIDVMPGKGEVLTPVQIQLISDWIDQGAQWPDDPVDFWKQVYPIIELRCLECHNPEKLKGDFRLDEKEFAFKDGDYGTTIVPGAKTESGVYNLIALPADDIDIMPSKGDPLKPEQIKIIGDWIDQGANWPERPQAPPVDFRAQIQPILAERCYQCHGPDKQRGSLRFDQRPADMLASENGPVVVSGSKALSKLYQLISLPHDDLDIMPAKGDPLNPEQIEAIGHWIDQGAEWPEDSAAGAANGGGD